MAGLKINLKKKTGPKKLLKRESADDSKKLIESYNGASETKHQEAEPWVIKPKKISRSIVQPQSHKQEEPVEKLKYGVTTFAKTESVQARSIIKKLTYESDSDSSDDDDAEDGVKKIPVEEFGAAFLRGLGWDGKDDNDQGTYEEDVKNRQRGVTLGIGAKPIDDDLARELQNQVNDAPLLKRRKKG
ncbi:SPP2 [Candida theae]|uniref:SPP2 n=1 Tax=Candida theae TaxID=1198502 RepID=A0AAD5FZK1_9ASCO|nr:SPP2 [Candida theae]KAI5961940.1 SPP2 [Candida theae]